MSIFLRKNVIDTYEVCSIELGEAQTIEEVWEEYFADPLQWWDNRVYKVSLGISLGALVS